MGAGEGGGIFSKEGKIEVDFGGGGVETGWERERVVEEDCKGVCTSFIV